MQSGTPSPQGGEGAGGRRNGRQELNRLKENPDRGFVSLTASTPAAIVGINQVQIATAVIRSTPHRLHPSENNMTKTYGSQSMVAPLRRVLVRRPDESFAVDDPDRWHYTSQPNLAIAR